MKPAAAAKVICAAAVALIVLGVMVDVLADEKARVDATGP